MLAEIVQGLGGDSLMCPFIHLPFHKYFHLEKSFVFILKIMS